MSLEIAPHRIPTKSATAPRMIDIMFSFSELSASKADVVLPFFLGPLTRMEA
jgi:hypothetical protein